MYCISSNISFGIVFLKLTKLRSPLCSLKSSSDESISTNFILFDLSFRERISLQSMCKSSIYRSQGICLILLIRKADTYNLLEDNRILRGISSNLILLHNSRCVSICKVSSRKSILKSFPNCAIIAQFDNFKVVCYNTNIIITIL